MLHSPILAFSREGFTARAIQPGKAGGTLYRRASNPRLAFQLHTASRLSHLTDIDLVRLWRETVEGVREGEVVPIFAKRAHVSLRDPEVEALLETGCVAALAHVLAHLRMEGFPGRKDPWNLRALIGGEREVGGQFLEATQVTQVLPRGEVIQRGSRPQVLVVDREGRQH